MAAVNSLSALNLPSFFSPARTLRTRLWALVSLVKNAVLFCFAWTASFLTCRFFPKMIRFVADQKMNVIQCWKTAFHPTPPPPPLPFTSSVLRREYRIREGEANIANRLQREWNHAQTQMTTERPKDFVYLEECPLPLQNQAHGNPQIGVYSMIGRRDELEDEHLITSFEITIRGKTYPVQLLGVFDGHSGISAASFVKKHLPLVLAEKLKQFNSKGLTQAGIWNALKLTSVELNRAYYRSAQNRAGTTLNAVLIFNGNLWTMNVGDTRAILDRNGTPVQLSEDAKPEMSRYKRGIQHRGGRVWGWDIPRINGMLGVGRAIGDFELRGAASARPKITRLSCQEIPAGSILAIGCDGIWDVTSTVQMAQALRSHAHESAAELARKAVYSAYQAQSEDNLTLIILKF